MSVFEDAIRSAAGNMTPDNDENPAMDSQSSSRSTLSAIPLPRHSAPVCSFRPPPT